MKNRWVTMTFRSQPASWDFQYQCETSELGFQTLLINSNYWKQFNMYIYAAFLRGTRWRMNCGTSRLMGKKQRYCTLLYILWSRADVAGVIYEWKVKGKCILIHYLKNNFIFNYFSVRPGQWHETWHFSENSSKCNYLCTHLQVWFREANGTVRWQTFQVPDRRNSIDLADFSSTRPMEFQWPGNENSKFDAPSPLSMNWAELHFWPWEASAVDFKGRNWKNDFNYSSLFENWRSLENPPPPIYLCRFYRKEITPEYLESKSDLCLVVYMAFKVLRQCVWLFRLPVWVPDSPSSYLDHS